MAKTLSDWELWACAATLERQYGEDAPIFAAMQADKLLEKADIDGSNNWRLIMRRIDQLAAHPASDNH